MKLLRDKKGMTLVEVVVVLLIMSILLVIMGSLILNAFKYFNQTTDQDLDKRSLDSISEYVREELLYAQDVRVYSTSEVKKATQEEGFAATQWQTLFIKEGKLYKNGEMVYTDSFYNQKKLYIDVQGIKNYRLDIHYSLKEEDKKTYETNDTLELLNLKVKIEKTKDFYPFKNIVDRTEISEDVQIYYQKVKEEENIEPDVPVDPEKGTVADQIKCLTLHNNRWKFVDNHYYRAGDMVYHNGYWWQLYNTDNYISGPQIPGIQNTVWKKIDAYFDENSIYLKGDIVIFNNKYYKCLKDCINYRKTPKPVSEGWNPGFWEECEKPDEERLLCATPERIEKNKDSVIYKLQNLLDSGKITLNDIEEYDPKKTYKQASDIEKPKDASDFVKVLDSETGIYKYYIKMVEGHQGVAPGEKGTGSNKLVWQEIKVDWDAMSYYAKDDVVFYKSVLINKEVIGYIRAKKDIDLYNILPDDSIYNGKDYWKRLD